MDEEIQAIDRKYSIERAKHGAAASTVQQMAGVMSIFLRLKMEARLQTARNNYHESNRLDSRYGEVLS